ncbi:LysM peptidoglycan-binding domain-containing protein, partial [Leptospira interrogans serovar Pomona]
YGTAKLWRRIYEANRSKIRNPNLIYPKQVLLIPPKKGPTQLNKAQDSRKKKPVAEEVEAIEADQKPVSSAEESESGDADNKKKAETMTPPATEDESAENDEVTPE